MVFCVPDHLEREVDAAVPLQRVHARDRILLARRRRTCVAPNSSAQRASASSTSTAMILPGADQPRGLDRVEPDAAAAQDRHAGAGWTFARLKTGPAPASTPQLTRHTTSSGASLRIGMTLSSGNTEWVA
jgi:hypothetical protein